MHLTRQNDLAVRKRRSRSLSPGAAIGGTNTAAHAGGGRRPAALSGRRQVAAAAPDGRSAWFGDFLRAAGDGQDNAGAAVGYGRPPQIPPAFGGRERREGAAAIARPGPRWPGGRRRADAALH